MNKIKLVTLLSVMIFGGTSLVTHTIPMIFSVIDTAASRLIIIGDGHKVGSDATFGEKSYFKVLDASIKAMKLYTKPCCWVIENLDKVKIDVETDVDKQDCLDHLITSAIKNNYKSKNLSFISCDQTEKNSACQEFHGLIDILKALDDNNIDYKRYPSEIKLLSTITEIIKNPHFTVENFLSELRMQAKKLDELAGSMESFAQKKFLIELREEFARRIAAMNKQFEGVPGISALPYCDALVLAMNHKGNNEKAWDGFSRDLLPLLAIVGDVRLLFQIIDLMKSYSAIVVSVGHAHAKRLKEFLNLFPDSVERVALGNFDFTLDNLWEKMIDADLTKRLPLPKFISLCQEWIIEPRISTGLGEAKVGEQTAAQAVADLRPGVPMSAVLVGEPISAAATPSAAERKIMAESRGAAAMAAGGSVTGEAIAKICPACGKSGNRRCSRCKTVYYCSTECQAAHWPAHKDTCTAAKVK